VVDGLTLLDEAMVAALDSRLGPFTSGTLYCHTIASCHEIADLRRMTRWTDLTEDWLSTLPAVGVFGGLCGVHRAQLHRQTRLGTLFTRSARFLAEHVANPQTWELPGVGHFAPVLAPESVAEELITFFESARQPA
jgi:hypothetical protein